MAWIDTNTLDQGHRSEQKTYLEQIAAQPGMDFVRLFFMDSSSRPSEVFVGQGDQARMTARVGSSIAAITQREKLTEMVELPKTVHPWYVGVQFHPEFKSTPWDGHPLFIAYIKAALDHQAAVKKA